MLASWGQASERFRSRQQEGDLGTGAKWVGLCNDLTQAPGGAAFCTDPVDAIVRGSFLDRDIHKGTRCHQGPKGVEALEQALLIS